ncbi:MAG: DUF4214 domain-containing protein, partial [Epsilonproteobacteria bacterium]|nr:DUF4214 domain-containing protein [Campylobacterota bacterium]
MALTKTEVSELYVAIFNRASEGEGNKYWQTQGSLSEVADKMLATDDAKEYFNGSIDDNQAFIELIYQNTLSKTPTDDPDGIAYWVSELEAGKTRGEVVAALVTAVADYKDSQDAKTKAAYDQFMNRVAVSDYTADHLESFDSDFDYKTELSFDKGLVVTNDPTTVITAESKVDNVVKEVSAIHLVEQPEVKYGTDGDDFFDGSVVQNAINGWNVNTFTSSDNIDGGLGNDTILIQQLGGNVSGILSNIENVEFTAFGATTYDMSNNTGVKNFTNLNSVANVTVDGATEMNIGVKNVNGKTTTITFDDTSYVTTTDSTTLTLENVTNGADIILNASTASNDIETLNIVSTSASSRVDMSGSALDGTKKLVITGDKDLSMSDSTGGANDMSAITTVDASAFTGDLKLDLTNGNANKLDIASGTGDDVVSIVNFTKDDKVDLGEGNDRLNISLTETVSVAASLTNIENLGLVTNGNYTVNLASDTALENIILKDGANTIKVTKASASAKTITFDNENASTTASTYDSINFGLADATGTSDELTLQFQNTDAKGNHVRVQDDNKKTVASITANKIETININTQDLGKNNDNTPQDSGLEITALNTDKAQT